MHELASRASKGEDGRRVVVARAYAVEGAGAARSWGRDGSWMSTLVTVVGRSSPAFLNAHKMFVEIPKKEEEEEG